MWFHSLHLDLFPMTFLPRTLSYMLRNYLKIELKVQHFLKFLQSSGQLFGQGPQRRLWRIPSLPWHVRWCPEPIQSASHWPGSGSHSMFFLSLRPVQTYTSHLLNGPHLSVGLFIGVASPVLRTFNPGSAFDFSWSWQLYMTLVILYPNLGIHPVRKK